MPMPGRLWLSRVLPMFLLGPTLAQAAFTPVFFGDSFSDVGNTFEASEKTWPWPPYFEGRTSNGLLWTELLVSSLGSGTFRGGMNRAMSSSTVDKELLDAEPKFAETGVAQQMRAFRGTGFAEELKREASENGTVPLFFVWVGVNDLMRSLVVRNDPTSFPGASIPTVSRLLDRLVQLVSELYAEYPRSRIVLLNVVPVDQAPILVPGSGAPDSAWSIQNPASKVELRRSVLEWNGGLLSRMFPDKSPLDLLLQRHPNNATHAVLDAHKLFSAALSTGFLEGESEKLLNTTWPCLDSPTRTQNCSRPDAYLWWDYVHPTAMVHRWIGGWTSEFLGRWLFSGGATSTLAATATTPITMVAITPTVSHTATGVPASALSGRMPFSLVHGMIVASVTFVILSNAV